MLARFPLVLSLLLAAASTPGQAQPAFEVAAIRPTSPTASMGGVRLDGALLHMAGMPFREYLARAYRVRLSQVIGPDWISSERFDVDAKLPQGAAVTQVAEMLQALLADRFALKQHREEREMAAYALVLGGAPKLTESPPDANATQRNEALVNVTITVGAQGTSVDLGQGSSYILEPAGRFVGKRMTAGMLASTLERYSDRPVVDMTGLTGMYDVTFSMTAEDAQALGIRAAVNAGVRMPPGALKLLDSSGNPLATAIQQLGLKLEARRIPVAVLVVDDARRVPTEN